MRVDLRSGVVLRDRKSAESVRITEAQRHDSLL